MRPGTCGRGGEPCRHLGQRHAEAQGAGRRGERVGDVEVTQQRERHLGRPEAAFQSEAAARGVENDTGGPHVGCGVKAERDPARRGRQNRPGRVVEVHDLDPSLRQHATELQLRREVRLHGPMVVEMVARQVGEHPGGEAESIEATLVEAVGRCLHGHSVHAALHQRRQGRLQVDRARRGQRAGRGQHGFASSIERAEGADAARRSGRIEQVSNEAGGRGLAVGSGDADQGELPARMTIPCRAERQRRAAAVPHHDLRHTRQSWRFDDHRRGAAADRVRHESVAIGLRAADGHVHRTGDDRAAVRAQRGRRRSQLRCRNQQVDAPKLA